MRRVHDYLTLACSFASADGCHCALEMGEDFYLETAVKLPGAADQLCQVAADAGFKFRKPEGTYYLFTDASSFGFESDRHLWEHLLKEYSLATRCRLLLLRPDARNAEYPLLLRQVAQDHQCRFRKAQRLRDKVQAQKTVEVIRLRYSDRLTSLPGLRLSGRYIFSSLY